MVDSPESELTVDLWPLPVTWDGLIVVEVGPAKVPMIPFLIVMGPTFLVHLLTAREPALVRRQMQFVSAESLFGFRE